MLSITSVKPKSDVPTIWLQQHKLFAETCRSEFYAFSLERGTKDKNLHVQGVMTCRCYATDAGCVTLREVLKSLLNVNNLEEGKITVKACAAQQTPTYMLGYIQKDKLRTHYDVSYCDLYHSFDHVLSCCLPAH